MRSVTYAFLDSILDLGRRRSPNLEVVPEGYTVGKGREWDIECLLVGHVGSGILLIATVVREGIVGRLFPKSFKLRLEPYSSPW